jgi:hypothetical protein
MRAIGTLLAGVETVSGISSPSGNTVVAPGGFGGLNL